MDQPSALYRMCVEARPAEVKTCDGHKSGRTVPSGLLDSETFDLTSEGPGLENSKETK